MMADEKQMIHASGLEKPTVNDASPEPKLRRVDEAMKAFAGHEGQVLELDEATSRRLLRKIDLHIMPVTAFSRQACCGKWRILMIILIASVYGLLPELPR